MVSKADIDKAKKANQPKASVDATTARLWACHDKHIEKIEQIRKVVEEERFHKGGNLDGIDEECKFQPEIYSRDADEQYRSPDAFVQDQMEFLMQKMKKQEDMINTANKTAVTMFKASEASNKMLEGKDRGQAFERLHKKKVYSPRKNADEVSVAPEDAAPVNIPMHRGAPISVALYEMNRNQQQKMAERKKREEQMAQLMIDQEVSKTKNAQSS
jgi:hypothetical protein